MVRRLWRGFECWVVLSFVSFLLVSVTVYGSGNVNWTTELSVPLSGPMLAINGSTVLNGGYNCADGYGVGGTIFLPLPDTVGGTLSVNAYHESDIVINWPVGTWGVNANAAFSLQTPSLSSFSSTANVTAYGTSTTAAFSLAASRGGYTTRLTLELAGTTLAGFGITATSAFGTPNGSSCGFCFTGATIGLDAFPWGCVHPDIDFVFAPTGFEKVSIGFDVSLWDDLLTFDGTLEFSLQTKTLTITPHLNLGGGECFWLSVGIEPHTIGSGTSSTIDKLSLLGGGLGDVELGSVTLNAISSFGGNLFRNAKSSDIDLHSDDYYVALGPDANPRAYIETDYDTIITVQEEAASFSDGFSSSQLTLDFYFGSSGTTLFGFSLFTAEWQHEMSEAFSYRIAVQLDPTGANNRIEIGFTASTILP